MSSRRWGCIALVAAMLVPPLLGAVPSQAAQPRDVNPHRQVDVGWNDACVLERDGTVRCWGTNEFGPVSQVPADLPPAVSVSVGTGFACVMTVDRQARCWGVQGHGGWPAHGQTEVP
ncbi:MAG: hypothetical protein KGN78_14200, partial [Actinomycetales bacterium]|nr:hypothetical protein [Actinomycetales bacterium]